MSKATTQIQPSLTQPEAAAEARVPVSTHRMWRDKKMFEKTLPTRTKGKHSRYPFDAVLRGNLLGAMNGWPISDDAKKYVARWAEIGHADYHPVSSSRITEHESGARVSTYDPTRNLAPGEQQPRYLMVRLSKDCEYGVDVRPNDLKGMAAASDWESFFVLDVRAIFERTQRVFGRETLTK